MPKPRVTARKYQGDDRASWAVFIDGVPYVTGLTRPEVSYYKKQAQERVDRKERPITKPSPVVEKISYKGVAKVKSLAELYRLAAQDTKYLQLLVDAANNLGGSCQNAREAEAWLDINAQETSTEEFDGEKGVVDEVNGLIDL